MPENHEKRRAALRARLFDSGLATSLLVTNLVNVRYLCGFTGSNAALLITPDETVLATDFRYLTQSAAESPDVERVIERACAAHLTARAGKANIDQLLFEADDVTVHGLAGLKEAAEGPTQLIASTGVVEGLRIVKDEGELADLAEACRVSGAALEELAATVRIGQTERELARRLEGLMFDHGADAISFETIVAGGPHSAIPHHQPTDRPIETGDFLKIDFGAAVRGYHADCTRTFVVGREPADWQREIYGLVAAAQAAGVAAVEPGAVAGDIDAVSRAMIAEAGYGEMFGHGLGHGVGLEIHEAPTLGVNQPAILLPATPVTVEPGVYLPDRGGVRIEDTLVVRAEGPELLTTPTRELVVLG